MSQIDSDVNLKELKHQLEKLILIFQRDFPSNQIGQQNELLTKKECMEILKCPERTLTNLLYEKKILPYSKIGKEVRIKRSDLNNYIENLPVVHHRRPN